jgi:hypothetical protein
VPGARVGIYRVGAAEGAHYAAINPHASNIFKCSAAAVPCLYVRLGSLSALSSFLPPIV